MIIEVLKMVAIIGLVLSAAFVVLMAWIAHEQEKSEWDRWTK